ncbi:MAG TPA: aspartyl protease family protein [Casimicrobiaceae bacterium]|nr:aspartyl protease family protein [Casimicrobiaceae bacterium]
MAFGVGCASAGVAAAANCQLVQIADLPVRLERNHLLVDGAINGKKIGVMLDTGSVRSLILRSAAERLELSLQDVRDLRMFGVGGELRVEAAYVNEFMVGQAVRKNWRVLVAGDQEIAGSAFILGEDFFHQVDIEFDLAHNAVRLYQPRDCAGAKLAYWATGGAGEVDIEEIDDAHPQIILTVLINGQPVRALLDSGAGGSVLNKADAARLGVTPETPGVVALGGSTGLGANTVDNWSGPFESFAIGDEVIRNTTLGFADLWKDGSYTMGESRIPKHPSGLMLLGFDFLRAHRVLVAHSQRKIYFTYVGGPVFQRTPATPAPTADAPRREGESKPGSGAN